MEIGVLSGPGRGPAGGGKADSLVIALHGYGSNGDDLISLVPFFAAHLPRAAFLSPHAPMACELSPSGYQWFSLREWSPAAMLRGALAAAPALNAYIDDQLKRLGLGPERLALIGFSQGTMMALYAALRRSAPIAGVVGFSGALVGEEGITSKPPVCLVHGMQDSVVPFAAMAHAESLLKRNDVPVEAHARPSLAHSIDEEGIRIAARFLKARLG